MKPPLIFACLFAFFAVKAQKTSGKVLYHRVTSVKAVTFSASGPAQTSVQTIGEDFELTFDRLLYQWENTPTLSAGFPTNEGESMVRSVTVGSVRETAADNPTYYNILTQKVLSKRELGAKTFVVEDSIQPLNWKITEDHKTILEHPAKKALAKRITYRLVTVMENGEVKQHKEADTSNITAWYALDLPVSAGPEVSGLPGLILELDINQGFMVYTAVQITDKVRPGSLKEPKGKRISVEEFEKEKNRVMQEIRKRGSNDPEVKGASN